MLDSLRGFAKSWPGKVMGAFLLVGVAGFGINNVIADLGTNTVARVGDQEITSRQFIRAYQNQLNQLAPQLGSIPTAEQAMSLGIPSMVLQNLAQEAGLTQMANNFGLGVSDAKLSDMLRKDSSFWGTLGTFDPSSFKLVLQRSGLTEAEYFEMQGNVARRQQLVLSLFADVQLPNAASTLINRYVADTRTVDYFVLGDTNIETPAEPTEDELAAYLTEHQSQFRTVETRTVQMLELTPAALAATKTVTDAEIAAEYDRTKDSLVRPERRTIEQVVLATEQQVKWFDMGLTNGKTFATLVSEAGLTPTPLGTLSQAEINDSALATAAFGVANDGFVVIDGATGKRAVHVSAIEAGGAPTLEEAKADIAQSLALTAARNDIANVLDQVEELRAAFRPLSEIAERFGLNIYDANVTAGGTELNVLPNLTPEDRSRLSQAIFKSEVGGLTPATQIAGSGNVWFDLKTVDAARDETLDEVRDEVASALTNERTQTALLAAAADAAKRIEAGEAVGDVAASYNVFPQLSTPFTRFGAADGSIDGTVASSVFAGGEGHAGSAVSQDGEHVVFKVVDVIPAEGDLEGQARTSLENEARVGIYGDFVTAVSNEAGLRVNQQALEQTLSLSGQ
ncbi:hypothetical protein WH87_03185 [Devosia epidermidihirudinis]|uniref:PpiC domain-containing protein n=1 Tax=Devosia epidermidihirudinis TaxID=1293439 RepID=A0A0F5QE35_9HYPH|nr:peptidylprolyl isomerase [Devosia epidermidihirudinis]KKC39247.1 hypothetical protein WH87_03185 [Devosia epidermidihirudinis]